MIYVPESPRPEPTGDPELVCPVCSGAVQSEKGKVVCRRDVCTGRVVVNGTEL